MPVELLEAPQAIQEQPPRWFDRYTANELDPKTRAKVVDMLARGRDEYPYARIIQECQVCEGVLYAIKDQEQETIEQRKTTLRDKFFRLADKALDRAEETINNVNHAQAIVTAGISTERGLQVAGEPTQRIEVNITTADDLYSKMDQLKTKLEEHPTLEAEFTKLHDQT